MSRRAFLKLSLAFLFAVLLRKLQGCFSFTEVQASENADNNISQFPLMFPFSFPENYKTYIPLLSK